LRRERQQELVTPRAAERRRSVFPRRAWEQGHCSIAVTIRVFAVPGPCTLDDFTHRVAGLPAKFAVRGGGICHERGRVTFAATNFTHWDRVARNLAAEFNDFLHARTVSGAEVELQRF